MKRFVRNIVFFLLPIGLFAIGADVLLSRSLKQSPEFAHGEYPVWNDIYNGSINAEVVIYGSSRAWVHIDPQMIQNQTNTTAYNLGIDGHGFWLQYLRHLELMKHNDAPKTIIMSVDAFTFRRGPTLYNKEQFLPYILNYNVFEYTAVYEGFSKPDYVLPLARYIGNKNAVRVAKEQLLRTSPSKPGRIRGYRGSDKVWNKDLDKAKKNSDGYLAVLGKESLDLFDQFLRECKAQKIEVVLVYTPEHIEGQSFIKNRSDLISTYKDFAHKYELRFLDYTTDPMCSDKSYFYNATHLNKKGSKVLTQKLINDLQL